MNERPRFLAELANEDRNLQTPRRVEAALRQRVAAAAASRKRGLWERFRWPVMATAAVALAVWILLPRASEKATPELAKITPAVVEPAHPMAPVETASVIAPAQSKLRRTSALPRVAAPVQERITRRFYELAYAPPELLANSRMMRVRVPRAALLSFGLPLSAYQAQDEKVAADVIYTEDGVARAIRFVETNNNQD